ncbi:nucleoside-diphosphate kinase [Patescibacteria group bacterium]|nr:nucleoside-diphosphate kinase [Patescibacteria group bacterium]
MSHPKKERTLVIIKPDGVQRTLIGEIIQRFERAGLKMVGIKMVVPTPEHVEKHYTLDPEWRRITGEKTIASYVKKGETPWTTDPLEVTTVLLTTLKKYMASGPVIPMVWEGAHAAEVVKKITGITEPRTSDVGTIRGDFVLDSYMMADTDKRAVRNLVHASGSSAEAQMEIPHWFNENELIDYRLVQEQIIYDVNLDGIME